MSRKKAEGCSAWKNRIVGHAEVEPKKLLEHPANFRVHSVLQKNTLDHAIERVGYIRSVTVNRNSGRILDGHLRVKLAIEKGEKTIPVEYVELTPKEERLAIAVMDPLTALAAPDPDKIEKLAKDLDGEPAELRALIDGLKTDEIEVPEAEESTVTFQRRADTKVAIGAYRFTIKRRPYHAWVRTMTEKYGHEEAAIIEGIKEKLGL